MTLVQLASHAYAVKDSLENDLRYPNKKTKQAFYLINIESCDLNPNL